MSNKTNIIITSMSILGVMLIVVIGFILYFRLDHLDNSNIFYKDEVEIIVGNINQNNLNIVQNEYTYSGWDIKNIGTSKGYVNIKNIRIRQSGGINTSNEKKAGDIRNIGNLKDFIKCNFFIDNNKDNIFNDGDVILYKGLVSKLPNSFKLDYPLKPNDNFIVCMEMELRKDKDCNHCQGDIIYFDVTCQIKQKIN